MTDEPTTTMMGISEPGAGPFDAAGSFDPAGPFDAAGSFDVAGPFDAARPFEVAGLIVFIRTALSILVLGWTIAACAGGSSAGAPSTVPRAFASADTLMPVPVSGAVFDDARAVAVDPLGYVYVADAGKHVVVKLAADGAVAAVLGGPGSREGEFDGPSGIEPTNGLVLFVSDAGNHRIQKFSRSHAYLGSIPVVIDDDGRSASRITYRRNDGGADRVGTGRPGAVASSDAKDLFAIDDDRNVILKWDDNHRLSAAIGDVGAGRGSLTDPVDLAVGPRSFIYVADRGRGAIVVYDAFGSLVRVIGDGSLDRLRAVATTNEHLFVGHERALSVFGIDGGLEIVYHVQLDEPLVDLTVGPRGIIFMLTSRQLYTVTID